MNAVEVRRAVDSEVAEIWQLTHDEYVREGYIKPQPGGVFSEYEQLEWQPETIPLVALLDGDIVGTVTVTLDGVAKLHTDVDFPDETEMLRKCAKLFRVPLACSWRIVTDYKCRSRLDVAIALQQSGAITAYEHGSPIIACTFHPRHSRYYHRTLGFVEIARSAATKGLSSAPAVLMVADPSTYNKHGWLRLAKREMA